MNAVWTLTHHQRPVDQENHIEYHLCLEPAALTPDSDLKKKKRLSCVHFYTNKAGHIFTEWWMISVNEQKVITSVYLPVIQWTRTGFLSKVLEETG